MTQPNHAFAIRGEGTDALEIDVYDDIGESFWGDGVSAKDVRRALKNAPKAKLITLRVNSRGGDVFDGFAIHNLLLDHPARVEADVDALAASMASVVLMAADEIRVAQGALIMIHNPIARATGEAEDLRGTAELLDKVRDQIADAYVARTGLARDRVIDMMDAETWMTPEEAKANGFADVVKPAHKGPATARAFASLSVDGLLCAPTTLLQAIAGAKRTLAKPTADNPIVAHPRSSARAAAGVAPTTPTPTHPPATAAAKTEKKMDLKELRAQHPDVYDAAVQEGVEKERKRVCAHLKLGAKIGAMQVATAAIEAGASTMDEDVHADYMAAGLNRNASAAHQTETDAAGAAADGAAPVEQPKDLVDRAADAAFGAASEVSHG